MFQAWDFTSRFYSPLDHPCPECDGLLKEVDHLLVCPDCGHEEPNISRIKMQDKGEHGKHPLSQDSLGIITRSLWSWD